MRTRLSDEKSYKPDRRADPMDIVKGIVAIVAIIGGTITVGDRLWASKESVVKVETKIESIVKTQEVTAKQIAFIHKIFMDAGK